MKKLILILLATTFLVSFSAVAKVIKYTCDSKNSSIYKDSQNLNHLVIIASDEDDQSCGKFEVSRFGYPITKYAINFVDVMSATLTDSEGNVLNGEMRISSSSKYRSLSFLTLEKKIADWSKIRKGYATTREVLNISFSNSSNSDNKNESIEMNLLSSPDAESVVINPTVVDPAKVMSVEEAKKDVRHFIMASMRMARIYKCEVVEL